MSKNAVVTGAGSGVGQAVALALIKQGWQVAIVGRRTATLQETIDLAGANKDQLTAFACDIGKSDAVEKLGREVLAKFGAVEVLVNAAGTNAPKRALEVLSLEDYHGMMDTNLNGAYYITQAFLPSMRAQKSGTIVHIVSDAGKQASPKAGPAYVMSKFGLAGLTQSINAEERGNGIRATAIFPGDIDTPLLDKRPSPPPAEARAKMMRAEDVAECAMLAINLPSRAIVEELIVRPR
ncbi:MAG: SDR family oxidoreductase [Verrucomicrobia bacterium]|nr:SDR family oxidoreductase [Verrucomicrobiota bacterium]